MTSGRLRAPASIVVLIAATVAAGLGVALLTSRPAQPQASPAATRATLLLLTSLPLVFGEEFSLADAGSPALKALQSRYRVTPISVSSPQELSRGDLLLIVQPRAQSAEDLVALDAWVRKGGRLLLLADPMLEWPSALPLGDPQRPPPMFADTGLLGHWGLRLDAPEQRGPQQRRLAGHKVATVSPGLLFGRCQISVDAFVADCRIGRGRAMIVADADFLDVVTAGENLEALLAALALLARN